MGQSSSQPVPGSDSQARTCLPQTSPDDKYKPRYTPTMDDFLASQQLVEEEARAEHATSDARGRSPTPDDSADGSGEEQPIDLTTQPPAPSQQTIPCSPPSAAVLNPLSLTPACEDPAASQSKGDEGAPQPQSEVEVPDSQLAPASPRPPITPAATSSFAIPATLEEGPTQTTTKKKSGKSRQSLLAEVNGLNSVLSQGTPSKPREMSEWKDRNCEKCVEPISNTKSRFCEKCRKAKLQAKWKEQGSRRDTTAATSDYYCRKCNTQKTESDFWQKADGVLLKICLNCWGNDKRTATSADNPAATSSFAIPATLQEGPTQNQNSGKSQQSLLAKANSLNTVLGQGTPSNDNENTTAMPANNPPASAPETKRKRKKTYATPPSTTPGSEQAAATRGQDMSAMSFADVINGAEEAPTPIKRTNKKKRGSLIQALHESPRDESVDSDNATAQSETMEGLLQSVAGRLRKLKRSKPLLSARPSDWEDDHVPEIVETPSIRMKPKKARKSLSNKASAYKGAEEGAQTPPASKKRKRNSKAINAEVLEQDASGATDQPDADPPMQQNPLADEDDMQNASSTEKSTPKPTKERKSRPPPLTNTPARRYARKSTVDLSKYAADRELTNNRDLNHPPVLPASGRFTPDEDEVLRRAISDFQQRNDLSTLDLVAIIQWTDPSHDPRNKRKKSEWDAQELEEEAESKEFWQEILHTEPQLRRKPEIIKSHVQARYHTFKSGGWTEEEDEELKGLMEKHPSQWKTMSLIMSDRSATDILNRWKDYVQYGEQRNTARWTRAEEESLVSALTTVIQRDEDERDKMGLPSVAEYANTDINWLAVCELMGKVRSRLQCTVKWTQMKKRDAWVNIRPIYKRGRTPDPTRPAAPNRKPKPKKRKSEAEGDESEPRKKRGRPWKSEAYVDNDDLDIDEMDPDGDFDSSVASDKPRKSRAKRFKAHDPVEEVDETDDEPPATATPQKRRQSTRPGKKNAEAAIREALGQDVVAPEQDADEVAVPEEADEVTSSPEEDDEVDSEEVNEEVTAPSEEEEVAVSEEEDEVAASEDINGDGISTPEEHDDQVEAASEALEKAASEELDEVDVPSPVDNGHDVAAAEQDVELEVPTLGEDTDQEEEAVQKRDVHEVLTPAQHDEEIATPEDKDVQEVSAVEVHDPSASSDSVRQEELSAASQMSKSSTLRTSQQPRKSAQVPPVVCQMKWGDKLDIIEALVFDAEVTDIDDVVWHELADLLERKWSPPDLETEVKELLTLVPDQGTWARTLKALRRHLQNNIDQDKLSEHHDPFDGPFDDGKVNAGLQEETESRTEANEPNSKKKRNTRDKSTEPRTDRKKRRKRGSMPKTPANK